MPNHKGAIYLKANCDGCKALQNGECVLGFKTLFNQPDRYNSAIQFYAPMDPCPKPRTLKKLREILLGKKGKR